VTALAVTPLEVVKVRQQASLDLLLPREGVTKCSKGCGTFVLNNGLMECVLPKSCVPYFGKTFSNSSDKTAVTTMNSTKQSSSGTGILQMLKQIFKAEGIGGVYAGLRPTLVMSVPSTVLYFTAYDEIVCRLKAWNHEHNSPQTKDTMPLSPNKFDSIVVPIIGGSSARMLATAMTSPLELVRTRQAHAGTAGSLPKSTIRELQALIRESGPNGGILSLYRGLTPTLWRDVPFSAIYWLCLERFKLILQQRHDHKYDGLPLTPTDTASHAFLSGVLAGMIAAACTTPFDVVKTRKQVSINSLRELDQVVVCDHGGAVAHKSGGAPSDNFAKNGIFSNLGHIARTEGLNGLFRGNFTRMIKVAPACAIMITCYESGKKIME